MGVLIADTIMRTNQRKAVDASLQNDFESCVHFHATGTGKSWIALQLLSEFHQRYPQSNVMWICEQKSILTEQFDKDVLVSKGYHDTVKQFLVLDYTQNKEQQWTSVVNSCQAWKRPILLIVNRAFLTSCTKYTQLKTPFHLIIHDECHSISNRTTQTFYQHSMAKWPNIRCIGFSATPLLEHEPFTKIGSHYTIYDGVMDGVILPPRIVWMKSEQKRTKEITRSIICSLIQTLPYQKLILWCGIIDICKEIAAEWKETEFFRDWLIAMDTSEQIDDSNSFATYEEFRACKGKGLLFCASKHREGSDIPYLDGCIFLDEVEERNPKTFVQCMGRVLRRDPENRKQYGLVIDCSASSSIRVCERMNKYLHSESSSVFPFQYSTIKHSGCDLHILEMLSTPQDTSLSTIKEVLHTPHELIPHFKRPFPTAKRYLDRLQMELEMIASKRLNGYLLQAVDILQMTEGMPHVTRGSCGSSLVCYLLGISHVDPIRHNIHFARFLNEFRATLPDIDFDFPHTMRDDVFLQIQMKWPGKVARISNHVYYHKKSAIREAVRRSGIRSRLTTLDMHRVIRSMPSSQRSYVYSETKKLENTFRTYSLHCGGIVFYPAGVPSALKQATKRSAVLSQIMLNKRDIAKDKHFKIDILSSRAMTQLYEANGFRRMDFEACLTDPATAELFATGNNIGITLAESPLIRKIFLKIRPKTVDEIAQCLAIIRPAARDARVAETTKDLDTLFVYDDDAIDMIAKKLSCSFAEADRFRRGLTKGDVKCFQELQERCQTLKVETKQLFHALRNLRQYSFCKSHAYSYAQLVWQLGYMKANHPKAFWQATLKHCQSSYRKWVHIYEAQKAGVSLQEEYMPHQSIYAQARHRNKKLDTLSPLEQMYAVGYWIIQEDAFYPNCYLRVEDGNRVSIRGLLAHSRILSKTGFGSKSHDKSIKAVLLVGVDAHRYVEVIVSGKQLSFSRKVGITCQANLREVGVYESTEKDIQFW